MTLTPTPNTSINRFRQIGATPLTTVYTPPPPCSNPLNYPTGDSWAILTSSSCAPFGDYFDYQRAADSYYSPGVCPYSYDYVATSIQQAVGGQPITLAVCCPPGSATWQDGADWRCRYTIEASDTAGFFSPLFTASSSSDVVGRELARGPVSVAWQESDLSRFTPASAPVLDLIRIGAIAIPNTSTDTNNKTPSPTSTPHHSSGLSTGAAAGIGVGVTLAVVALIIGLWCILRRYQIKLSKRERTPEPEGIQYEYYDKNDRLSPKVNDVPEAPYNAWLSEVDSRTRMAELAGDSQRVEAGEGARSPT